VTLALGVGGHWYGVRDGDDRARALYERHYSVAAWRVRRNHNKPGHPRFTGPDGIALLTADCSALLVWRRERYRRDGQVGVNCAVFRREEGCPVLASELVGQACGLAWQRWPGERLFTFVDPSKVRSTNPGYCFLRAGFRRCGVSSKGLVILERLPEKGEAWQSE
jgi:hypothetical protein